MASWLWFVARILLCASAMVAGALCVDWLVTEAVKEIRAITQGW